MIGATGKTGRRVVERLEQLGVPVRSASRTSETVFDWTDRTTWSAVLAGAVYVTAARSDRAAVRRRHYGLRRGGPCSGRQPVGAAVTPDLDRLPGRRDPRRGGVGVGIVRHESEAQW